MKKILFVYSLIFISCLQTFSGLSQQNPPQARLRGKLNEFSSKVVVENFSDIQYMVPDNYNQVINANSDGTFDITIPLTEPTFFRVGRNKLYLTPGDNLEVVLEHGNSSLSVFKGKGSSANHYLRNTPFPKGGSFVAAGQNLCSTPDSTLQKILELANERKKELSNLKNVTKEFTRLEQARINADIIKSITSVPSYFAARFGKMPASFQKEFKETFNSISKPIMDSLLKDFIDPSLLQLEVYRDIYSYLPLSESKNPQKVAQLTEWKSANSLAFSQIKQLRDKSLIPSLRNKVDSFKTERYRVVLNQLLDDKMKFGNGDIAIDLEVRQTNGTSTNLSSLRGKLIYIDLWATWCGPCLGEMPHLETLKKKYEGNPEIAIVALSVDDNDRVWLANLEKRKPDGIQWRIDRAALADYAVLSIPRYIIIDRDFKIADFNAAHPSEKELLQQLDTLLKK